MGLWIFNNDIWFWMEVRLTKMIYVYIYIYIYILYIYIYIYVLAGFMWIGCQQVVSTEKTHESQL